MCSTSNINCFLSTENLAIVPSPGDGHCLLHSTIASLHHQLSQSLSLESLKSYLYTESVNNISEYISFITDSSRSLFSTYLRQYIIYKNYNNQYGDIAPLIIANALQITLIIIDESLNNSINRFQVQPRFCSNRTIYLHRKQDHYNGIRSITPFSSTAIPTSDSKIQTDTSVPTAIQDSAAYTSKPTVKTHIRYTSDQLHKLSGSQYRISRHTRKKLFAHHIWKPRTAIHRYDSNKGVHPKLLKSLRKSNIFHSDSPGLHLAAVNTCSIRNKTDDFMNHIIESDYDVCFLTETWLQESNPIDNAICHTLNTDRHNFISCPRPTNTRGGGIGIYYRNNLKLRMLQQHIHSTFEMCLVNIEAKSSNIIVLCVYRPPYSSKNRKTVNMFTSEFADVCSSILSTHTDKRLIIVGDFNIHMDEPNNTDSHLQ